MYTTTLHTYKHYLVLLKLFKTAAFKFFMHTTVAEEFPILHAASMYRQARLGEADQGEPRIHLEEEARAPCAYFNHALAMRQQ